jgi:hypothetical protein
MRSNDLCHIQCYTGHASAAMHPTLEGQFGPTEWIIRRITRKRKSGNLLIIIREMNKFSYLILHILHDYNVGISWLRLEDVTPITCPTLVGRRDSGCIRDSSRLLDSGQMTRLRLKDVTRSCARLWSHARLQSEDVTLVVCATPIVCPTSIGRRHSGRMPDSDWKIWLQSYIPTPVTLPDSSRHHDSGNISWLQSCIMALVEERAACLTYSFVKDYAWLS